MLHGEALLEEIPERKKNKEAARQEACKGRGHPGLVVGSLAQVACSLLVDERIVHPTHSQIPDP